MKARSKGLVIHLETLFSRGAHELVTQPVILCFIKMEKGLNGRVFDVADDFLSVVVVNQKLRQC